MEEYSNNSSSSQDGGKSASEVIELVFLSQVTFLTLFGNSLVILAFVFGPRSIRTFTNYFVVNLSISDLLVGCVSVPFWIVLRIDASMISDTLYLALIPVDVLSGITSILCLAAISFERTLAVKFPSTHFNLSKGPVMTGILVTWLGGIILSTSMYGVGKHKHSLSLSVYTASIFTLGFLIPLLVIVISYCLIFYTSLHMMKASNDNVSTMREIRIAKTISLVIGLFVICWSPFFIVNMVYVFCRHCSRPKWPIYVSKMMHYSNSTMNFFIYSVRSPDFRNFFKKVLCPWQKRKRRNTQTNASFINRSRTFTTMSDVSPSMSDMNLNESGINFTKPRQYSVDGSTTRTHLLRRKESALLGDTNDLG